MLRLVRALTGALASYCKIGWWGLVSPRVSETRPLVVLQAVILGRDGILLAIRSDLWGWELPGGEQEPGESPEDGLRREIREETGLEVEVERHVGDYERTGFRPHTARVYRCRVRGGALRTNWESLAQRFFPPDRLPETLFPWYREPIRDALAECNRVVHRRERQGPQVVWEAMTIDLRMRLSENRAGLAPSAE